MMNSLTRNALQRLKYLAHARMRHMFSCVNERPVFVLGNQKSGTSALVSLLALAAGKTVTNDVFTWYGDDEQDVLMGQLAFPEFVQRARYHFSHDFIKDPSFTFLLASLQARFPLARYIFVVRDPRLNIRGILNRVDVPGTTDDLDDDAIKRIRATRPGWLPVLSGSGIWTEGTHIVRLAHRCRIAMEIATSQQRCWPVIRYEDFLDNKSLAISSALEAIGERARCDISFHSNTSFQPPSKNRAAPLEYFGQTNLVTIETICKTAMEAFEYK